MNPQELLESCRTAVLALRQLHEQQEKALPTGSPDTIRTQQFGGVAARTNDATTAALQLYDGLKAMADKKAE